MAEAGGSAFRSTMPTAPPGLRNEPMSRWYGGMVHEMGHMFGLPDSSSTDGTPMSASFYQYPDCDFSQNQKNATLNDAQNEGFFE